MRRIAPLVVLPLLVCCKGGSAPVPSSTEEGAQGTDGCPRLYREVDMLPNSCETVTWSYTPAWSVEPRSEVTQYSNLTDNGGNGLVEQISYGPGYPIGNTLWQPERVFPPDLPQIGLPIPAETRRVVLDLPGYDGRMWMWCATDDAAAAGGIEVFKVGARKALSVNGGWTLAEGATATLKLPNARALAGRGVVAALGYLKVPRGGDLQVRAPGGPGWVKTAHGGTEPWHRYILINGDCGRVEVDADPALFLDAAFRSTGFDLRVGWGLADVELVPGSVLASDSHLQAGGAARLTLPASVAATVQVPAGWPVICYSVDNPACDQVGPIELRTTPAGGPTITLQAPVGLVELVADPWPADLPCPKSDSMPTMAWDVPDPTSALGQLARGEVAPQDLRRAPGRQMATGQHDACLPAWTAKSPGQRNESGTASPPADDASSPVLEMPPWPVQ